MRLTVSRGAAGGFAAAVAAILAFAHSLPGCSDVRAPEDARRRCAGWVDDVGTLLAERCGECHGEAPEGEYSLVSYLDALGPGSDDVANAIAGDASSEILRAVEPATADATHAGLLDTDQLARLREWVVDCELTHRTAGIHSGGVLNPVADDFHGELLRDSQWEFAFCQRCHGQDFSGGNAKVACTSCHTEGPTACNVCHGSAINSAPPRGLDGALATTAVGVGAHQTHLLGGALERPVSCTDCHLVPELYDQIGHIFQADDSVEAEEIAEVTFGWVAGEDAVWDRETETCSGVACHGAALADPAASNPSPRWTAVGSGEAACGTCHGLPPASHANDQCAMCHGRVVDGAGAIIDTELHLDGLVDVGDGTDSCSGCHGNGDEPAPPPDLSGNTATTAVGVGAHRAHLAASKLRGPIPCGDCHLVPAAIDSAGHIDSDLPAEVFPDDVGFDTLADADGAVPVWDRGAATCSGVYCHGSGLGLADDASPGLDRVLDWTSVGTGQATCGVCHGLPPDDGVHPAGLGLVDCVTCHPNTVDAAGDIIIGGGGVSKHINGVVDVP